MAAAEFLRATFTRDPAIKQRLMRRHEFPVTVDGTKAATILAQTMFAEGVRNVVAGASAIDLSTASIRCPRGVLKPIGPRQAYIFAGRLSRRQDRWPGFAYFWTLMARSDLLVSLVRAGAAGDREMLKSAAEALMADERAKKHHVLADRLQRALSAVPVTPPALTTSLNVAGTGKEAIIEVQPRTRFEDLLLPFPVQENGRQLVEEHIRADVLRAHGYEPRHRILLSGPPGNGKTSFAEAVAEALALPFFVVRYDALIGSYLGETNARLRKLFDYVRTQPSVLFFDEFDAIGKERGDTHETGEIKRVVSFLLMQLDQLPSYVVVVAATNHAELLDRAVWRRFQIRLALPAPGRKHVEVFLDRVISNWPEAPRTSVEKIAGRLGAVSYAEVLDFCQNIRRRHILALGEVSIDDALATELNLWSSRVRPEALDGKRSRQTPTEADTSNRTRPPRRKTKVHSPA